MIDDAGINAALECIHAVRQALSRFYEANNAECIERESVQGDRGFLYKLAIEEFEGVYTLSQLGLKEAEKALMEAKNVEVDEDELED